MQIAGMIFQTRSNIKRRNLTI
ncbi:MAG: hypothetical protein ACLU9T_12600 [Blautia faecis]